MTAASTLSMSTILVAALAVWVAASSGPAHQADSRMYSVADEAATSMASVCTNGPVTFFGYFNSVGAALGGFDGPGTAAGASCPARQ